MSLLTEERLYRLLPEIHRLRDAEGGEPLRALLGVIEAELERIERETARLYDNWFIETCDEWVVPYIGDLLGARPVRPVPSAGVSTRAHVANTIAYRRRKGTAVVLEQLARDVTGWPARAVEFFQRLATTQHMNHVRPLPHATAAIRDAGMAELAGGALDPFAHSAEVRRIASRGGRHNIPHIGLFLWRLRSYVVGSGLPGDEGADFASARNLGPWWNVNPVGLDAPLFNIPRTEAQITHLAQEENLPGRLRRPALASELKRLRNGIAHPPPRFLTDDDPVLRVFVRLAGETAQRAVPRERMYLCRIPDELQAASPVPLALAFDPETGRLGFPAGLAVEEVRVQAACGFAGDLGGGPYDRSAAVDAANAAVAVDPGTVASGGFDDPRVWQAGVSRLLPGDAGRRLFPSLRAAVAAWNDLPAGRTGVIVVMDSLSDFDAGAGSPPAPLEIVLGEGSRLLVVAGTWPAGPSGGARAPGQFQAQRIRAHLVGDLSLRGIADPDSPAPGLCFLNGLLIEGELRVEPGNLGQLSFAHGTLVPGHGGLRVVPGGNARLVLGLDHAICGAIRLPGAIARLEVADSLVGTESPSGPAVDAPDTPADLARSSFFGGVTVQSVAATDCIFDAPLLAARRQTGCVRFSHVPPGSLAPRRYRCQPELEAAERIGALRAAFLAASLPPPTPADEAALRAEVQDLIRPLFVSRRYGDPGFGLLEWRCAPQIRTGAESGAEMGAFEFLRQPQREANLRDALAEYLRFGLEAGLFHVD